MIKKLLLIFVGLLVLFIVFLAALGEHDPRPYQSSYKAQKTVAPKIEEKDLPFEFVREQGKMRLYYLKDANDPTPPKELALMFRKVCMSSGEAICFCDLWKDKKDVPQGWPMTEKEGNALYISYVRNIRTNHELANVYSNNGASQETLHLP